MDANKETSRGSSAAGSAAGTTGALNKMTSRCTSAGPCDAHRDGAPLTEKCPWFCDRPGCARKAVVECGRAGRSYCRQHASLPGRPVTTGSGATPKVFFRVSAAERERGEAVAKERGQSVGELAKRAFLEELG